MENRSLPEASSLHDVSLLENSSQVDSSTLPEEVWLKIVGFLSLQQRRELGRTSSMFARIKNELEKDEKTKYPHFILNDLSKYSLEQAQAFLDWFWQTTYYYSLRKKCILTPEELTAEEIFCFMLTRKGNEAALYEKLHKNLAYALATNARTLNIATQSHLTIIQIALTISIHINTALANRDEERFREMDISVYHAGLFRDIKKSLDNRIQDHYLNLSGINFSRKEIPCFKFNNVCLDYASFENAKLKFVKLRHASLKYVNFSNSNQDSCDFTGSFLVKVNFNGATLKDTTFSNSRLYRVNFINAKGCSSTFKGAAFFSSNNLSLVELRNEYNQIKRNIEYLASSNDFGQTILTHQYPEDTFYFPLLQNISENLMAMQEVTCAEKLRFLNQVKEDFGYTSSWRDRFFSMAPHPDSFLGVINKIESAIKEHNTYFQQFSSFFLQHQG